MFLNDKDPVAMMSRLSSPNYNHALAAVYDAAVMNSLPVALWRYPNEERYHAVVDFSGEAQSRELDLTTLPAGFVFSPFVNQDEKGMLFIKADFYFGPEGSDTAPLPSVASPSQFLHYVQDDNNRGGELKGSPPHRPPACGVLGEGLATEGRGASRKERNRERFFDTYHSLLAGCHLDSPKWFTPSAGYKSDTALDQATFCQVVDSAIDYLNHSDLEKIVVSRVAEEGLPEEFDPVETLISLGERYSHAFISLVAIPGVGTWMGATPERLLTMENGSLTTVALAGTQAKPATLPVEAVSWGAKEIREQGLVSDYIRAFFRHVGAEWEEEGPRTVSAGNVVHLQTTFHAKVDNGEQLALVNQVFDHLHPTSAVCGMPKEQALDFILKHEMYDRSFYSGFLGPTRLHGLCQLFVNLRCMQLSAEKARLYVGAGITSESHPKAEWTETVLKSQTLLSVLHPATGLNSLN